MNNLQNLTPLMDGIIRSLISTSEASDAFLIAGAPTHSQGDAETRPAQGLIYEILEGTLPLTNIIRSGQEQMILNEMVNNQHSSTINEQLDQLCFQTLITPEQAIRHSPDPRGLKVYR